MKAIIIFLIGFIMYSLGSYFSYSSSIIVVMATLGAIIMGCSFIFLINKKSNS